MKHKILHLLGKAILVFASVVFILPAFSQKPELVIQTGHSGKVSALAYSPDGKFLASAGQDFSIKIWDISTGKELKTLNGHKLYVQSLAFSPDGKMLASGSWDKTIRIWEMNNFTEVRTITAHKRAVQSLAFSPDGKILASGSVDSTLALWDVASGSFMKSLKGHEGAVTCVVFNKTGSHVASASSDKTVRIWDVNGGKTRQTLKGHTDWVQSVAFSPDGRQIVTSSADKSIRLWEAESGNQLKIINGHSANVVSVCFSPDGKKLASAGYDKTLRIWDIAEGKELMALQEGNMNFEKVLFSPDGKRITSGQFGTITSWNSTSGKKEMAFTGHVKPVENLAYSPDGKFLVTGVDSTVKVWELSYAKEISSFNAGVGRIAALTFSPDGKQLAVSGVSTKVQLFNTANYQREKILSGHTLSVTALAYSPDGKTLAMAGWDKTLRLANPAKGKSKALKGHAKALTAVAFSSDGKMVATGSYDNTIILWSAKGKVQKVLKGHTGLIYCIAFSPNNKYMATGSADSTVRIWDPATGNLVKTISASKEIIRGCAFSKDGNILATGGFDKTVKLWSIPSGDNIRNLTGHTAGITALVASPSGKFFATAGLEGCVKLWNLEDMILTASLVSIDQSDFAVITPTGVFDASPGAMKMMHYVSGKEIIEFNQIKERYYEPELLPKILGFNIEKIRKADDIANVRMNPVVSVTQRNTEKAEFDISLQNNGGGIGKVEVLVNGKEISDDARSAKMNPQSDEAKISIDLNNQPNIIPGQENTIEVKAYNTDGSVSSRGAKASFVPAGAPAAKPLPRLFVLTVGISDYDGTKIDLKYSAKDAEDITTAFEIAGDKLFGKENVFIYKINTNQSDVNMLPSRQNIIRSFGEIAGKALPTDVFVVYLAGHGINWGGQDGDFFYLTKEAASASAESYGDQKLRETAAISSAQLTDMIKKVPALKQVLMIDACASGRVVENLTSARGDVSSSSLRAMERMKDRTGMHIITGCAADAVSYEASKYGQGLLTYSLLEGIKGTALREGKYVDISTLFGKSQERVPVLASGIGGVQQPKVFSPGGAESFDVGLLDLEDKAKIPLAKEKPMFSMSTFAEEESMDDIVGLEKSVDEAFIDMSSRGGTSSLVYIETKEFPDAFRIRGQYKMTGDIISAKVNVFKGKDKAGSFTVEGKKGELSKLAAEIAQKAGEISLQK
ncbi:MAG: caspase family protein [Bacteroidota bacterium]